MELVHDTIQRYRQHYGRDPDVIVTAPGRVNLIGEHTDYNDGFVLPVAIDRRIILAAGRRSDDTLNFHSVDFQSSHTVSLSNISYNKNASWLNYPLGVAYIFQRKGNTITGANIVISGDIPIGVGLSSSAALEVASAIAFQQLNNFSISGIEIAKLAQEAENEFVGVHCGIMDQFVSVMGRKDNVLLLDCRTLDYSHIPFPKGIRLVICDSGIHRELAHSGYNRRQEECREAVQSLAQNNRRISSLRDVSVDELEIAEQYMTPILRRRARHVVTENDRVLKSVEAMKRNDLHQLGKLMFESHRSLRDNFEVSCKELDAFVDIAMESEGVYGARMTGAGFGGSGICIVAENKSEQFIQRLQTEYPKRVGRSLSVHIVSTDDGAAVIFPKQSEISIPYSQMTTCT